MMKSWLQKLKASQEKTEATATHYDGGPSTEAMHLHTTQQARTKSLKEQYMKRLPGQLGMTCEPATGYRVPGSNEDKHPS
jgi:hypothetical protein